MTADPAAPALVPMRRIFRVAAVSDDHMTVVINGGRVDGLTGKENFLIYSLSESPIKDPDTQEDLEPLETIRGFGRISHLQHRIATVRSSRSARLAKSILGSWRTAIESLYPDRVYEDELQQERPFDRPTVGDYARVW